MSLETRLSLLRQQTKMSKKEVAAIVGIDPSTYGKYELGKRSPSLEVLGALADCFQVSTDYLLGKSDTPGNTVLIVPEALQHTKVAFHRGEFEDLTQDEINALAVIAKTLKAQRNGETL